MAASRQTHAQPAAGAAARPARRAAPAAREAAAAVPEASRRQNDMQPAAGAAARPARRIASAAREAAAAVPEGNRRQNDMQPAAGAAARPARRAAPAAREAAAAVPEGNRRQNNFCPVYDAILVLQGKWTLHIVSTLLHGARGFNELARAIGGCNPATLAERLDTLEQLGLVTKTVASTMPPRTSYALTGAGAALEEVIASIDRWGERHLKPEVVRRVTAARKRRAAR